LLKAVLGGPAEQSHLLPSIGETTTGLPDDVGAAFGAQIASALRAIS
jgi:hypothetical protein